VILVTATVRVNPERRAEAVRAAIAMAAATRAEAGCREYRFAIDVEDPDRVLLFEAWESEEALARHFQTPHMSAFQAALPGLLAAAPEVRRWDAGEPRPM
jgi:quinol monooxygenase YgiN